MATIFFGNYFILARDNFMMIKMARNSFELLSSITYKHVDWNMLKLKLIILEKLIIVQYRRVTGNFSKRNFLINQYITFTAKK